jgi:hypothetical protein
VEHLDRDKSAEVGLPTPVDDPRAALAEALQHLVASVQLPPDERIGGIERISEHEPRLYIVERRPGGPMREWELLFPSTSGGYRAPACVDKPIRDVATVAKIGKVLTARFVRRSFQNLGRAARVHDFVVPRDDVDAGALQQRQRGRGADGVGQRPRPSAATITPKKKKRTVLP